MQLGTLSHMLYFSSVVFVSHFNDFSGVNEQYSSVLCRWRQQVPAIHRSMYLHSYTNATSQATVAFPTKTDNFLTSFYDATFCSYLVVVTTGQMSINNHVT